MDWLITQTAVINGKRYAPLYLCRGSMLKNLIWSGLRSDAEKFFAKKVAIEAMNTIVLSISCVAKNNGIVLDSSPLASVPCVPMAGFEYGVELLEEP